MIVTKHTLPGLGDLDGSIEVVSVSCKMTHGLKMAVKEINDFVSDEVFIPRPNSPYDCTGRSFTRSIDFIKRVVSDGYVTKTYLHYISIDC